MPLKIRSSVDNIAPSLGSLAIKLLTKSSVRRAAKGGHWSETERSRLLNAAERQGDVAPDVLGENITFKARNNMSIIED